MARLLAYYSFSSLKAFISETMAKSITKIKGKAAATEAVCRAWRPPERSRAVAKSAWTIPQISCFCDDGFKSPCEESIPSTKVAEFAEVIKKVPSRTTVISESMVDKG